LNKVIYKKTLQLRF